MTVGSSLPPLVQPPLDGFITVFPGLVDFHATHNAQHTWAVLASDAVDSTKSSVSFLEYAKATHRVANALRRGREGPENETVAILVNCDTVLYLALIPGMIRAGLIPFPMSPKNTAPAVINMLKRTSCHRIICQPSLSTLLSAIQAELDAEDYALQVDDLPAIEIIYPTLYGQDPARNFRLYPVGNKPVMDDIAFYLHSSGSTGFPKPIPQRYVNMLETCNSSIILDARDRGVNWGPMALPPFHAMGIYMQLYASLAGGHPIGLFAPRAPALPVVPTPQLTLQVSKIIGCTGIPTVPAFVESWAKRDEDVEYLKSLKIVAFAGGPLSSNIGTDLVAAGVSLYPWYGGTEFGPHTQIFDIDESDNPSSDAKLKLDWEWLSFSDRVNIKWVPESTETFELQFMTCKTHHPNVENLENVSGYSTSDLWQPHPTKKGLWRITGRKDDVLVLGSGEKVVPIPQEGLIGSSLVSNGAVMFGRGKNQCGVLIEPSVHNAIDYNDRTALPQFRNAVWPVVEEANRSAPTFARIFKEMIIVTDPARPLPRAAKGTVIRKQALAMYEKEIDDLYVIVENSGNSGGIAPPRTWATTDVETWLISHASAITNGAAISPSIDVFDQGFDSLHATFLRNRIIGALRSDSHTAKVAQKVSQNFVFEHPTLHELAYAIMTLASNGFEDRGQATEKQIEDMIRKYTADLPKPATLPSPQRGGEGAVVLLTGSTGNVGSQILATLLADQRITKVYTLNRPSSVSYDRQQSAFVERGLDPWLLEDPKLTELVGDLSKQYFGLEPSAFVMIKDMVTHILHNAWRVDFNLSLSSFEGHVARTRKLIDFCSSISRPIKYFFTSSVSATHKWDVTFGPVPEEVVPSAEVATNNGYGASKFVVEQILAKAAENGLQCTSLRLGQVCGSKSNGAWASNEWLPILVKSSVSLEVLPHLEGVVSWLPADAVARAIVDMITSEERLPVLLNLVHPRPVSWRTVCQSLNKALTRRPLTIVPFDEWLSKVEQVTVKNETSNQIPAIKLLDYYRSIASGDRHAARISREHTVEAGGQPIYSTRKMQRFSPSLRDLDSIDDTHTEAWVKYWRQRGFL